MSEKIIKKKYTFKITKITGMVIGGIVIAIIFAFIFGYIVQLLWNWLMPELFGFKTITYWQGFGLVILTKIFFGGFGKHHDNGQNNKDHWPWHKHKNSKDNKHWSRKEREHFDQFWEDEGKNAFEDYVKKMRNNNDEADIEDQ